MFVSLVGVEIIYGCGGRSKSRPEGGRHVSAMKRILVNGRHKFPRRGMPE